MSEFRCRPISSIGTPFASGVTSWIRAAVLTTGLVFVAACDSPAAVPDEIIVVAHPESGPAPVLSPKLRADLFDVLIASGISECEESFGSDEVAEKRVLDAVFAEAEAQDRIMVDLSQAYEAAGFSETSPKLLAYYARVGGDVEDPDFLCRAWRMEIAENTAIAEYLKKQ